MTKLHACTTTLALLVTTAGAAWAQPVRPAPPAPAASSAQSPAFEAARADMERALLAARVGLDQVSVPALAAIERALAESEAVLASGQAERARAMAELMAGHDAALAGHEALVSGWAVGLDWPLDQSQTGVRERAQELRELLRNRTEREADIYQSGYEALNEARWDRALDRFNRVIEMAGPYADRALYWKAYAQYKLGQGADALQTIGELQKSHPRSRYLADAQALAVEVRENAGQPADPNAEETEELKLLALRALQNSDPQQAVPMLEGILRSNQSPRLKQRALFVLAQSRSPQARQVLASVARGEHNPDLQLRALQYLGFGNAEENRALLAEVYASSEDVDVRRRILRAYGTMKDRERLLQAAGSESSAELRSEAVRQLGIMKAHDALATLYQRESDPDVKQDILRSMFIAGNVDFLLNLARTETNPDLKRTAVRNLGMMPSEKTGDALKTIYEGDSSIEIRKAAVMGLYIQKNDIALVDLARKETDAELKKEIVGRLSLMKTKVALDYLMELLKK